MSFLIFAPPSAWHVAGAKTHGLLGKECRCQQPRESERPGWGQSALKESGCYVQKLRVKKSASDGIWN